MPNLTDGSEICICIGHREGNDVNRTVNLISVLNYYKDKLPRAQIILVEQDVEKRTGITPTFIDYQFVYNKGGYNRSWAFNVGYNKCDRPIFICADNDVILKLHALDESMHRILSGEFNFITPYWQFYDLSIEQTKKFRNDYQIDWDDNTLTNRYGNYPMPRRCGGMVVCSTEHYKMVRGFNEAFVGWGAEDEEFMFRCTKEFKHGKLDSWNLYHMYHERNDANMSGQPNYKNNLALFETVMGFNKQQNLDYIKSLPENFGNPNKYKE